MKYPDAVSHLEDCFRTTFFLIEDDVFFSDHAIYPSEGSIAEELFGKLIEALMSIVFIDVVGDAWHELLEEGKVKRFVRRESLDTSLYVFDKSIDGSSRAYLCKLKRDAHISLQLILEKRNRSFVAIVELEWIEE